MTTVHIVTSRFFPQTGGLERWTYDLVRAFSQAGLATVIYVCNDEPVGQHHSESPFEVVDIAPMRAPWEEPLKQSKCEDWQFLRERSRLNFACVKAAVTQRLGLGSNIILSNFVTSVGFTAHLVAEVLDLPHIPVIAGTDFTKGFRGESERQIILEVCRSARVVVGKSQEQIGLLVRRLPGTSCKVIETSVELPTRRWRKEMTAELAIFSDGGFSFKKGTGVLMDAFDALRAKGIAARLEICGSDQIGQEGYWSERRRLLESKHSRSVSFPGYLSRSQTMDRICTSQIYASATLGEGSSAARALALCLGAPMVTTACGELAQDTHAEHVRLVPVGDTCAFHDAMFRVATDLLNGRLTIDEAAVSGFRSRFDPKKEWQAWLSLIHEVTSNG